MNVWFVLDLRMHDKFWMYLTDWFLFVLSLKLILEQIISPDLAKFHESCYTLGYYGWFLSTGVEITQTNNTVVFVEIWWLHTNLIFLSIQSKLQINTKICYFATHKIYWELFVIPN